MRTEITRFLTELGDDLRHLDLSDQQLALQEQESQSRESIRREILAGLSLPGESIDDTFDVRTAEIRRRRLLLAEQRLKVQADIAEGQRKMLEIDTITSPEKIAEARHELQRNLSSLLEEQKALETLRRAALDQLTECQRMVEDMEERQLLIEYAQKVGLVLTSNSTDELIRVCRTHQEKIAAKNAAVDGDNPPSKRSRRRRTSRSTSSSDEEEVYLSMSGDCTCSRCVREPR
jgi:hypothetical protein